MGEGGRGSGGEYNDHVPGDISPGWIGDGNFGGDGSLPDARTASPAGTDFDAALGGGSMVRLAPHNYISHLDLLLKRIRERSDRERAHEASIDRKSVV